MTGDDDYGDAFKKAKLEHDQQREGPTEAERLRAEADADTAVLSNVVLPQLTGCFLEVGAAWRQSRNSAIRSYLKSAATRIGCIPHSGSAGSARSAGL